MPGLAQGVAASPGSLMEPEQLRRLSFLEGLLLRPRPRQQEGPGSRKVTHALRKPMVHDEPGPNPRVSTQGGRWQGQGAMDWRM